MQTGKLGVALGAVVMVGLLVPAHPSAAQDLVKAAAALVLADEEPPPTRSQMLKQMQEEEEAKAAAQKKQPDVDDTPVHKKWWFWALTAAVVGGTVGLAVWAIEPSTQPARACTPGVIGCFGDGRR
jgi:hypothetical protein